ncbi:MAG: NAD(P)/FAD-dependent oxidoreductase [Flavonifractor plautii]
MAHGATEQVFSTETAEARAPARRALEYDLHLLQARCKHLGTENNLKILQSIYEEVRQGVEFRFRTAVTKIENLGKEGYRLITDKGDEVDCTWLIAGPGRSGAEWFSNQCKELGIQLINNQVDIGVRVELPAKVFEHITDVVYESKLVYRTKQYGDQVRTFCMNPYGHVVAENVEGINTVNGHSYSDPKLRSENTNFALLVSNRFTSPFNEPYRYGKHIASLSNNGRRRAVQRFGDLVKGCTTSTGCSLHPAHLHRRRLGDRSGPALAAGRHHRDDHVRIRSPRHQPPRSTARRFTCLPSAHPGGDRHPQSLPPATASPAACPAGASGVQAARAILAADDLPLLSPGLWDQGRRTRCGGSCLTIFCVRPSSGGRRCRIPPSIESAKSK